MRMANGELRNGLKRLERGHPQLAEVINTSQRRICANCGVDLKYVYTVDEQGRTSCMNCLSVALVGRRQA